MRRAAAVHAVTVHNDRETCVPAVRPGALGGRPADRLGSGEQRRRGMKAVLLSIQPQWCEKIASGEKTVEVRKTAPKLKTPFKCYM